MIGYEDIKKTRKEYSISQTKLAEFSGFSKAQISAWELGQKRPIEPEIRKLDNVLKEIVVKINQGDLNVKKKKVQHSKTEKRLPSTIKDAQQYLELSKNMTYSSEYAKELSRLYKDAMMPQGEDAIKGLKGHRFEEIVTDELNKIDFLADNLLIECNKPNIYYGNPARALVKHISQDKKKQIPELQFNLKAKYYNTFKSLLEK